MTRVKMKMPLKCLKTRPWNAMQILFIIGALSLSYAVAKNEPSHCTLLHENFNPEPRSVEIYSAKRRVVIMSTERAPSRATAALLAAALRHRFGYEEIVTTINSNTLCQLASSLEDLLRYNGTEYNDMIIHVDADWKGPDDDCDVLKKCKPQFLTCNIAGSRLEPIGVAVALNTPMHVRMSDEFFNQSDCSGADHWEFYSNLTLRSRCGFPDNKTLLLVSSDVFNSTHQLNLTKLRQHNPFLEVKQNVDRRELIESIQNGSFSFLFIDYDLWRETDVVKVVEGSPPVTSPPPTAAFRVVDMAMFKQYAPIIMRVLTHFKPHPNDIRQVLEHYATTTEYNEAACSWATDDKTKSTFNSWTNVSDDELSMMVLFCDDRNEYNYSTQYKQMLVKITEINRTFGFYSLFIDCDNMHSVSKELSELKTRLEWQGTIGVLAPGSGAMAACDEQFVTALILYDVPPARANLGDGAKTNTAVTTSTGRLQPLARAIRRFLTQQDWRRLAIISETSPLADDLFQEIFNDSDFIPKHVILKDKTSYSANAALVSLQKANARIYFLNMGHREASIVACEAAKLGMTSVAEYAWVAREWHWNEMLCNESTESIRVLTVSYWWRGGDTTLIDDVVEKGGNTALREAANSVWGSQTWPPSAAPMADAYIMMYTAVERVLKNYPNARYDIHGNKRSRLFAEELAKTSVAGMTQNLIQKDYALKDPLVFVSAWCRNVSQLLAVWKAYDSNITELKVLRKPYEGSTPDDGHPGACLLSYGDAFSPKCNDVLLIVFSIAIIIVTTAWFLSRRARTEKFKKREETIYKQLRELKYQLNTTSQQMNFIDRSSLRMFEKLGAGHYGLVRSGLLLMRNRDVPELVAVKALRKNPEEVEEAEFIREARALATLAHENVVRLVGVCAGDGQPPLLIMEHAFFGDLLHYLRDRRYLLLTSLDRVSDPEENPRWAEARYVSARELTRLAREAATALAHLRARGLLHRDLRAANCLIDSTRTLKLADFGLVRWVKTSDDLKWPEDADYEYVVSQRTTAFPVRWMAPESIIRGEFSYASDVWALGVLILEVVTLGMPPYGDWSANHVIHFVKLGGRPPVPRDVSMHTIEVTNLCFAKKPELRASAEIIGRYLCRYPESLVAARREPDLTVLPAAFSRDDDHTDSGFGDRAPDADWPLPTDPCISTI